ncbi:hypothetical protein BD410DRAFT_780413 [Rickenella mellea]|uniref:RING-type domain-containing protein n=1 Tax=Rickenella mellea TaxID=50990 RepID=A0A4R5XFH5_9AGAM|nr:hypothetical protein BD410DRAFT_780413 [Rickenella mellea]
MVLTRSSNAKKRSKQNVQSEEESPDSDVESPEAAASIKSVLDGISRLRRVVSTLESRNAQLQSEVDRLHNAEDVSIQPTKGKRGGMSIEGLKARVRTLSSEVAKLQHAREKDKKKIRKLEIKEIKREAADLEDTHTVVDEEQTFRMRELLTRFCTLMESASLDENEPCGICTDTMEMGKTSSLPCQHVFCDKCMKEWEARNADTGFTCPTCRQPCELENAEPVRMTAVQQWDKLLAVAHDWARLGDHSADLLDDTDEEQIMTGEEEDTMSESAMQPKPEEDEVPQVAPAPAPAETPRTPPRPDVALHPDGQTSPHATGAVVTPPNLYISSPRAEKRKRMEELANQRMLKKAR